MANGGPDPARAHPAFCAARLRALATTGNQNWQPRKTPLTKEVAHQSNPRPAAAGSGPVHRIWLSPGIMRPLVRLLVAVDEVGERQFDEPRER